MIHQRNCIEVEGVKASRSRPNQESPSRKRSLFAKESHMRKKPSRSKSSIVILKVHSVVAMRQTLSLRSGEPQGGKEVALGNLRRLSR